MTNDKTYNGWTNYETWAGRGEADGTERVMNDQLRINDRGELEPVTWDGEPLYCRETVSESQHLFKPEAFEQMRGQTSMDAEGER